MHLGLLLLHEAGFVHRDLSPGNIIVVDRKAKISDLEFGKARKVFALIDFGVAQVELSGLCQSHQILLAKNAALDREVGELKDTVAWLEGEFGVLLARVEALEWVTPSKYLSVEDLLRVGAEGGIEEMDEGVASSLGLQPDFRPLVDQLEPGTLNFAAVEVVEGCYKFHLLLSFKGDPTFLYTPLHDYESVWWIATWVIFSCTLNTTMNSTIARDELFSHRAKSFAYNKFKVYGCSLLKELQPLVTGGMVQCPDPVHHKYTARKWKKHLR
ncbi:hypothetical protein BDM02DRAFT_3248424 [Thelephora ganbajun]|uniref:Uncharacterized protein n=1 Tax=Thelephora ganbajun TaxID=370292 RepID=A0ACB6ZDA6_THEGA|nr:hypothetical protein BDM02DRAFT_3248424 [Thelephora ganbajun]